MYTKVGSAWVYSGGSTMTPPATAGQTVVTQTGAVYKVGPAQNSPSVTEYAKTHWVETSGGGRNVGTYQGQSYNAPLGYSATGEKITAPPTATTITATSVSVPTGVQKLGPDIVVTREGSNVPGHIQFSEGLTKSTQEKVLAPAMEGKLPTGATPTSNTFFVGMGPQGTNIALQPKYAEPPKTFSQQVTQKLQDAWNQKLPEQTKSSDYFTNLLGKKVTLEQNAKEQEVAAGRREKLANFVYDFPIVGTGARYIAKGLGLKNVPSPTQGTNAVEELSRLPVSLTKNDLYAVRDESGNIVSQKPYILSRTGIVESAKVGVAQGAWFTPMVDLFMPGGILAGLGPRTRVTAEDTASTRLARETAEDRLAAEKVAKKGGSDGEKALDQLKKDAATIQNTAIRTGTLTTQAGMPRVAISDILIPVVREVEGKAPTIRLFENVQLQPVIEQKGVSSISKGPSYIWELQLPKHLTAQQIKGMTITQLFDLSRTLPLVPKSVAIEGRLMSYGTEIWRGPPVAPITEALESQRGFGIGYFKPSKFFEVGKGSDVLRPITEKRAMKIIGTKEKIPSSVTAVDYIGWLKLKLENTNIGFGEQHFTKVGASKTQFLSKRAIPEVQLKIGAKEKITIVRDADTYNEIFKKIVKINEADVQSSTRFNALGDLAQRYTNKEVPRVVQTGQSPYFMAVGPKGKVELRGLLPNYRSRVPISESTKDWMSKVVQQNKEAENFGLAQNKVMKNIDDINVVYDNILAKQRKDAIANIPRTSDTGPRLSQETLDRLYKESAEKRAAKAVQEQEPLELVYPPQETVPTSQDITSGLAATKFVEQQVNMPRVATGALTRTSPVSQSASLLNERTLTPTIGMVRSSTKEMQVLTPMTSTSTKVISGTTPKEMLLSIPSTMITPATISNIITKAATQTATQTQTQTQTKTQTTTTTTPTTITPGVPVPLLPWGLPGDMWGGDRRRVIKGKRKYKYTPSLGAILWGITGKQPKLKGGKTFTGLEFRPVPVQANGKQTTQKKSKSNKSNRAKTIGEQFREMI